MLRLSFSGIAAAALLLCFESVPVNAQNANSVGARWGYGASGFANGPRLTGVRHIAMLPRWRGNAVGAWNNGGRYNVYRNREGYGRRLTVAPGWGCPTCGFKNGPKLSGLREPTMHGLAVTAVTLPSGDIFELR